MTCALCGCELAGTVTDSVTVVYLDTDIDQVRNLRFCLDRTDANGKKATGCSRKILSPSVLKQLSTSTG